MSTPNLFWINCPCDWCGSSESDFVFAGPDRLEGLPGEFTLVRCRQCGVYRQEPLLAWSSLQDYYPENYASHPPLVKHEKGAFRRLDKRYGPWKRLRAIERFQPRGSLLEIGCGTGLFLEEALRSGHWQVTGVEPSQKAALYARENLKVPIFQDLFANVDFPPQSFDVVVMWNVLEHLDHPIADLRSAHQILKDNGWLVIAVPNLESLENRLFGKYWVGWDLPRHLYLFPRNTLHNILETLGFQWVDQQCISTSYSVLGHTLDFWSQSWAERHPWLRKLLLGLYHSLPGRALLSPPLWVLDRLDQSTIITIFAQKKPASEL